MTSETNTHYSRLAEHMASDGARVLLSVFTTCSGNTVYQVQHVTSGGRNGGFREFSTFRAAEEHMDDVLRFHNRNAS